MKWRNFEKEKPELGRKCLVKTVFNGKEEIEIGEYVAQIYRKQITYDWYSGCCHYIEDVKYWIYTDNLLEG